MYRILFTDQAKRAYEKLDGRLKKQVDKGLDRIRNNPDSGKPLRKELRGIYSERVSTFRILYKIERKDLIVVILVISHRKKVYGGH